MATVGSCAPQTTETLSSHTLESRSTPALHVPENQITNAAMTTKAPKVVPGIKRDQFSQNTAHGRKHSGGPQEPSQLAWTPKAFAIANPYNLY